jgi:cyclophilin family peptidyl-prolyl cis-trans isomerase
MRIGQRALGSAIAALVAWAAAAPAAQAATVVRFATVMGDFDIQLFDSQMPRTVANFLRYANANRYNGTVIHRNSDTADTTGGPMRDFVIQGGGFTLVDAQPVLRRRDVVRSPAPTPNPDPPITDEPGGGVAGPSNVRGTIAMAKSGPNTVTSQWFINQGDNSILDSPTRSDGGFSAFGAVLGNGMAIVDAIGDLPLPSNFGFSIPAPFNDLPLRNFGGNSIDDIEIPHLVRVTSVRVLNLRPGDFDRSGLVDQADLAILQANFGLATGALVDDGDADMDGDVDGEDLTLWQENLGRTSSLAASVPEPQAATLAAIGLAALRRRRRARAIV